MTKLTQAALERHLWGAADILRGTVDAADYKQYIFPLLFFKRLSDVWDEDFRQALAETNDPGYATATANDRGGQWQRAGAGLRLGSVIGYARMKGR